MTTAAKPNAGKALEVTVDGQEYLRIPLKTKLVLDGDNIDDVITEFAKDHVTEGDILFVTEKIVAITQGRSYLVKDIKPRKLATFLSRYVTKTAHGIGLGMPETMEMALRECGTPRILLASAVAAATKPFGRRGDFYRVAGPKARAIDGPTSGTIPPFNESVVLGPDKPKAVAQQLQALLQPGVEVAVVDINDIGGNILGSTLDKQGEDFLLRALKDNPLGQEHQSTPLGILRKAPVKQAPAKKAPAKKAAAKKPAAKKPAASATAAKKPTATKAAAKAPATKKPAAAKAPASKTATSSAAAKKKASEAK